MLVLSRKKNEKIIINNNITIILVDIKGEKAYIGIDAPAYVSVHRKEVQDTIDEEIRRNQSS